MPRIFAYEATRVPRYHFSDDRSAVITNLIGQRAFLTSALSSMCAHLRGSLELRFRVESTGRVRIFVAITTPDEIDAEACESGIRVVERLLPQGYAWARTDGPTLNGELADQPIRIARLVRTMEFVDLPPVSLAAIGNLIADTPSGSSVPVGSSEQRKQPSAAAKQSGAGAGGRSPRELPPLLASGTVLSQLRLCLPILGPLSAWHAEARVLMEELQASKPAVVSIHLRPTLPGELDQALPAAALWRLCLKGFLEEIAGSGIADPRTIIGGFARYALPPAQLTHISMRCGASNDRNAMAIASVLAACLGGARSFTVLPPAHDVSVDALRNIWSDYPRRALSEYTTDSWKNIALRTAREANVLDPDDAEAIDLLGRAPHIFTIDEVEIIAQLPIAGEEGLPGLDTEMVTPFYGGLSFEGTIQSSEALSPPSGDEPSKQIDPFAGRLRIGQQMDLHNLRGEGPTLWHHIPQDDLSKHAFIVGSTGSGKTVTTTFLARELIRLNVPFLIIEPVKTEYLSNLVQRGVKGVLRYNFEGNEDGQPGKDFLPFDPMRLQANVTVARHASYLKSCFEAAFPLEPVTALILENGIRQYYMDGTAFGCRLGIFSRGGPSAHTIGKRKTEKAVRIKKDGNGQNITDKDGNPVFEEGRLTERCLHPSLNGFMSFFLFDFLPTVVKVQPGTRGAAAELLETWTQLFERRFEALKSGMIGIAAKIADQVYEADNRQYEPFSSLLRGPTVLELDGIPDDEQKSLMMAFLMVFLFERRQAEDFVIREAAGTPAKGLAHVVVIEEAHRILTNVARQGRGEIAGQSAQAKTVSLFVDMLAEMRAFGQGLVIVEQIPTKIVPEAVKNTNLKIMLRLTAADDRDFLGEAMNLSDEQKRFVTSLRADADGVNMVVFEQQLDQPKLLKLLFVD